MDKSKSGKQCPRICTTDKEPLAHIGHWFNLTLITVLRRCYSISKIFQSVYHVMAVWISVKKTITSGKSQ